MLSIPRAMGRSIAGQVKLKQEARGLDLQTRRFMRRLQWFFLVGTLFVGFFFLFWLACDLKKYLSLKEQAPAKISQWELEEMGDRWAVRAVYSIQAQGRSWENSTLFARPRPSNEEIALRELQQMAKQEWKAWYSPASPALSSLERVFPFNLLIRTVIVFFVSVYFFLFKKWLVNKLLID